jgi:hypothetical protein
MFYSYAVLINEIKSMRAIALILLLVPVASFGWGVTGHKTVCTIAYDELTSTARAEVNRLISMDSQYDNFADSCLYADGPPRIRTFDHFLNVPRSYRAISKKECPLADTCVLLAVDNDSAILANSNKSDAERLEALKLLGHWVGDLHQPMHISFQDDLGANQIRQKGNDESSLHGAWDFSIIDRELGDDHIQIAADLRAAITAKDRKQWRFDSSVEWVDESFQITLARRTEYCTLKNGACWYDEDNMMLNPGEEWKEVNITKRYTSRHRKTVEQRLQQAGLRLAVTINKALDSSE